MNLTILCTSKEYLHVNVLSEITIPALALMIIHKDISVGKEKVMAQCSESARRTRFFKLKERVARVIVNTFIGFHTLRESSTQ